MIFGRYTKGAVPVELVADTKIVVGVLFGAGGILPKLTVLLDGNGSGNGDLQVARPIIYLGDALLAVGDEFAIQKGTPKQWYDMLFTQIPGGVVIPAAGPYNLGIHAGGFTNIIRVFA